jgi:hypothetical protein
VTLLSATLPLLSVLIGSAITYWLNVRARQRSHVDDVFREAIAAVAVASSRQKWLTNIEWEDAPQEEADRLLLENNRASSLAWAQSVNEARAAVARASVYDPSLTQYYRGSMRWFMENPDIVIGQLRKHL